MATSAQPTSSGPRKKTTPPEVRETNREFLRRHPERGGRLINPNDPADRGALAEWRAIYADAKKRNQPQVPKAAPAAPCLPCQAVKQQCELKSAEVACEHNPSKRKYKIRLPSTDPKKRGLDVIAGNAKTKETILVKSVLAKPLCNDNKKHAARHIVVKPPFKGPEIVTGAQQLKFDVKSSLVLPKALGILGKVKILYKYIWPSYQTKDVYYVDVDACTTNGSAQGIVRVFPDLTWSIELGMSAGFERARTSKFGRGGVREIDNSGGYPLSFEIKATYKYDGDEQNFGKEFKTTYVESSAWMKFLKLTASWFRKIAYYAGNVKVTFPQIGLGFKYQSSLAENPDGPDVRRDVDLEVAADPLLGASAEVDLLELLINAAGKGGAGLGIVCAPAIADFLIKIKRRAAEGGSFLGIEGKVVFALTLGVSGGIGAKGALQIRGGRAAEGSITVEGKIGFTFGGTAQVEGKAWVVQVTAGVSLQGSAGFAGGGQIGIDKEGPFFGGKLYFSGAKLEFKTFYDVKITRKPPDPKKNKEAPSKSGWVVSWPAWPDEGNYNKRRFF